MTFGSGSIRLDNKIYEMKKSLVCSMVGNKLGGGLKYVLCSSLFGEMIQFD